MDEKTISYREDDEDLTLLTDSVNDQSLSQVDTIRSYNYTLKSEQDLLDFHKILGRDDERRKALAIRDIILSKRIPFSISNAQYQSRANEEELLKDPVYVPPPQTITKTTLPPLSRASSKITVKSQSVTTDSPRSRSLSTKNGLKEEPKLKPKVSKMKIKTMTEAELSNSEKEMNSKLQIVLGIISKAKIDVNSTKLYLKAAKLFQQLNCFDRSVFCFEQATHQNNPEIIIDTNYLPITVQYTRKLERMNDKLRETFLQKRNELRNSLIYEESERQRLRARYSHCQLFALLSLIPAVQDLWKAYEHLQKAFELCKDEKEQSELLYFFHRKIVSFSVSHGLSQSTVGNL
jgi:tetratricopeptide (TPR) repeat protein